MKQPEPSAEDDKRPATRRERIALWLSKLQFVSYTTIVLVLLLVGFLWKRVLITIPAGHRGVMYRVLKGGTVKDHVFSEGLHVVPPWDKLFDYETRIQQQELTLTVLSEEGLDIGISLSVRYRPNKDMLGYLHADIGPDYFDRLIKPEVESHARRTLGSRPAHEIYTSARDILQELGRIPSLGRAEAGDDPTSRRTYVEILELKLLDVTLPKIVESAIADRYRQEQLMLEYQYKLERQEKESDRMRTEAAGIRDYNLIAGKITPDLLRWRGIDATLELARSPNSKVVVLGGGQGNVSMLMNVDGAITPPPDGKAAPPEAKPAPAASAEPTPDDDKGDDKAMADRKPEPPAEKSKSEPPAEESKPAKGSSGDSAVASAGRKPAQEPAADKASRSQNDDRASRSQNDDRASRSQNDDRASRSQSDDKASRSQSEERALRAQSEERALHVQSEARALRAQSEARALRAQSEARALRAQSEARAPRGPRVDWYPLVTNERRPPVRPPPPPSR